MDASPVSPVLPPSSSSSSHLETLLSAATADNSLGKQISHDWDVGSRGPPKRRRRTTPAELAILEAAFQVSLETRVLPPSAALVLTPHYLSRRTQAEPMPDAKQRVDIAAMIGADMNARNVQIWFQSRSLRMKVATQSLTLSQLQNRSSSKGEERLPSDR
jgi:Homeodomain